MDLNEYTKRELFQAAIKSEKESRSVYASLAAMVRNVFLREKLSQTLGIAGLPQIDLWAPEPGL